MTLDLTATPTTTDVKLRATTDNAAAATIEVTRSMINAQKRVRAANDISSGIWAATDIEVLFNTPIGYQAVVRDAGGAVLETDTAGPVTVTNGSAYLRDVLLTASKMPVRIVGKEAGDSESDVRRELLRPLGRKAPVVITDVRSASTGSTAILTMTNAEQQQLRGLLDSGHVLMFTGPATWDMTWPLYLHFGPAAVRRVGESLSEARLFGLDWVQVDPPPLGLYDPVEARTWGDLLEADTQWVDIYTTSWLDVMFPITTTVLRSA